MNAARILAVAGAAVAVCAGPASGSSHYLDASFDGNGIQSTDIAPEGEFALPGRDSLDALAIDSAGRILAAGSANNATDNDLAVARYLPDGRLDPAFAGGFATRDLGPEWSARALDIAIHGEKVVVGGGGRREYHGSQYLAARFNADGSPDSSFSGDGVATVGPVELGGTEAWAVAAAPTGAVVLAGTIDSRGDTGGDIGVMRLRPDGELDPTFDGDGMRTIDLIGDSLEWASEVAVQPDGKILVAGQVSLGTSDSPYGLVARLNQDGALDQTFGNGGVQLLDTSSIGRVRAISLLPDGRILVAAQKGIGGTVVARTTATGGLDTSFGRGGWAAVEAEEGDEFVADAVGLADNGRILIGGTSGIGFGAVAFSGGGKQLTAVTIAEFDLPGTSVVRDGGAGAVQRDGKVVAGFGVEPGEDGSGPMQFMLGRIGSYAPLPDRIAPRTRIKSVRTLKRKRRVEIRFTGSDNVGVRRFQCRVNRGGGGDWLPCKSPKRYRVGLNGQFMLEPGRHRFAVRAVDAAGNVDRTPAKARFTLPKPRSR